ncbi:MAG: hypothetical protein R6U41_05335, partial [Desulfosalsimonas sp.]|uniref:hypothetical protein n=1 Tax=Desulfosalsimonas sp. TaxID=3073848 RepID=UPI003970922A
IVSLSRRRQGFKFPWGRQQFQEACKNRKPALMDGTAFRHGFAFGLLFHKSPERDHSPFQALFFRPFSALSKSDGFRLHSLICTGKEVSNFGLLFDFLHTRAMVEQTGIGFLNRTHQFHDSSGGGWYAVVSMENKKIPVCCRDMRSRPFGLGGEPGECGKPL